MRYIKCLICGNKIFINSNMINSDYDIWYGNMIMVK